MVARGFPGLLPESLPPRRPATPLRDGGVAAGVPPRPVASAGVLAAPVLLAFAAHAGSDSSAYACSGDGSYGGQDAVAPRLSCLASRALQRPRASPNASVRRRGGCRRARARPSPDPSGCAAGHARARAGQRGPSGPRPSRATPRRRPSVARREVACVDAELAVQVPGRLVDGL